MEKTDYALSGKSASVAKTIISETDGGLLPTVTKKDPSFTGDQRKNRACEWREARLSLAYEKGAVDPIYAAKIGTPDEIGVMIAATINRVGRGEETEIHCVGDGAPWIANQIETQFGDDAYYLLDIYHASEYLAEAAICCAPQDSRQWFKTHRDNLKNSTTSVLFAELNAHASQCVLKDNCSALKCYNYLIKRTKQLDYKSAIEAGLPIGSGKIEGGIRSVFHERMKKSGGWWKVENAQKMINLRTVFANKRFNAYGQDLRAGAFRPFS